jgi:hypothetical protein
MFSVSIFKLSCVVSVSDRNYTLPFENTNTPDTLSTISTQLTTPVDKDEESRESCCCHDYEKKRPVWQPYEGLDQHKEKGTEEFRDKLIFFFAFG